MSGQYCLWLCLSAFLQRGEKQPSRCQGLSCCSLNRHLLLVFMSSRIFSSMALAASFVAGSANGSLLRFDSEHGGQKSPSRQCILYCISGQLHLSKATLVIPICPHSWKKCSEKSLHILVTSQTCEFVLLSSARESDCIIVYLRELFSFCNSVWTKLGEQLLVQQNSVWASTGADWLSRAQTQWRLIFILKQNQTKDEGAIVQWTFACMPGNTLWISLEMPGVNKEIRG